MSPLYGIRFRKMTLSGEAFVKAWQVPAAKSALEPGEQVPESVLCRGNVGRPASTRPALGPDHVRAQALAQPPAGCVGRGDNGGRDGKPPRRRLALEATAAAPLPDEMPYLVECDEVAHLPADGRDPDLEPAFAAAVAMPHGDHDGPSAPVDPADSVRSAEIVDVTVESLGLHQASVVVGREVAVMLAAGAYGGQVS